MNGNPQITATEDSHDLWRRVALAAAGKRTHLSGYVEQDLVRMAAENGVSALLDRRVHEGVLTGLSLTTTEALRAESRRLAALDLALNQATLTFVDLLAARGIDALLLKGAALAHLVYDNAYLRPRSDIDVYIRAADLEKVARLLKREKYTLGAFDPGSHTSRQFQAARERFGNTGLTFDIHYRLSNREAFADTLPFDQCLAGSSALPAIGPHARVPSPEALLLHACIHRIAHGRNSDRNRLIWLYDIHLLLTRASPAERDQFIERALERRVGTVCADALASCADLFGTDVPDAHLTELTSAANKEPSASLVNAGRVAWAWSDLKQQPHLLGKLLFVREILSKRTR